MLYYYYYRMSQNIPEKLNTVLCVDPVCDFIPSVYAVEKSPQINNFYTISSTNVQQNAGTWTIPINSNDTIVDRVFLLDLTLDVSITTQAANIGDYALNDTDNLFAFRSNALTKWIQSVTATIGTSSVTVQIGDCINAFERYGYNNKYQDYCMTPAMLDNSAVYGDFEGKMADVLASYSNAFDNVYPRGTFPIQITTNPVATVANEKLTGIVQVRLIEPIPIAPFLQSIIDRKQGLSHLSQIQLQIQFGNPNRLVSSVNFNAYVSDVSFGKNSNNILVVQYIPGLLDLKAPEIQTLPYNEIAPFPTTEQALGPLGTATFVSSTIQLSRIPKEILIFARPTNTMYSTNNYTGAGATTLQNGCSVSDHFLPFQDVSTAVSVNFNGQTFLNNCRLPSLYKIARENGYNGNWLQFQGWANATNIGTAGVDVMYSSTSGPVLCLKFGKDIPLSNASWAPGTNIKANLQVTGNFINYTTHNITPLTYTMYVVVIYEGSISLFGSNTSSVTASCLSETDVLEAIKANNRVHHDIAHGDVYGGSKSFLDRSMQFLTSGKLIPYIEKFKALIDHPAYKEVSRMGKKYLREKELGGIADTLDNIGLGSSGGRHISKSDLKNRLMF